MKINNVLLLLLLLCWPVIAQVNLTSSNLPIIFINTNGQTINDEPKITANMGIIDNGAGKRNSITDALNGYDGKIGIEIRGHSSQMFVKKQYGIELRDVSGNSINTSLLGMPAESDWILNASFLDRTFLRNVLAYKLGNEMGRYASRTRFCELIINNEYMGVYILQEKIKRDKNRVNIKKLEKTDISGDALTGGYIMQIDRIDPGVKYFNSIFPSIFPKIPSKPSPISYIHVYPNASDILPVQENYIKNFITQFETSLSKLNYNDPFLGYYDFVDVDALVDYILISEFTKTVDAYRLSTYMYKNRDSEGGKLVFGPMWDYDLAFGLAEYSNGWPTTGWNAEANPYEGIWSNPFWIKKIFNDPVIKNKLAKRWNELKSTVFDLSNIVKYIDQTSLDIIEARNRNFNRWPIIGVKQWIEYYLGQTYEEDLLYLKSWIVRRYEWMDANLMKDFSDAEWQSSEQLKINVEPQKILKLPLKDFVKSTKNISTIEFVSSSPYVTSNLESEMVALQISRAGEYSFKGIAKLNNSVVSISPEYKINLPTGTGSELNIPQTFELFQNFPNPFNPETIISYQISKAGHVTLKVNDLLGREVETLVDDFKQPGIYHYTFSTFTRQDRANATLSTGIYFYTLRSGALIQTRKMILLR